MSLNNRFILDLQSGKDDKTTLRNLMQQMISLTQQLNQVGIPIVLGPTDEKPAGLAKGQPVIDWSSGTTVLKTWDGQQLV